MSDWGPGHKMEELPSDPETGERHFNCRNCDAPGHIDKDGVSSGAASYEECPNQGSNR